MSSLWLSESWHLSYFMTDHRIVNKNNTADVTAGAETTYSSGASEFTPGLCWVPVALSWVFCVFVLSTSVCIFFRFGHYIACFSIYGFWLPLCCLWVPATLIAPVVLLLNDKIIMWYGNRKSIWNMTHTKTNDGKEDTNIIFTRTSYRITFYKSTLITYWISIKRIVTCTDT